MPIQTNIWLLEIIGSTHLKQTEKEAYNNCLHIFDPVLPLLLFVDALIASKSRQEKLT